MMLTGGCATPNVLSDNEVKDQYAKNIDQEHLLGISPWGKKYNGQLITRNYKINIKRCYHFAFTAELVLDDILYVCPEQKLQHRLVRCIASVCHRALWCSQSEGCVAVQNRALDDGVFKAGDLRYGRRPHPEETKAIFFPFALGV